VIPAPGAHGGDGARVASALGVDAGAVLDLSVSVNPVAPDVGELLVKHVDAASRYPDPAAATAALAAALGVDTDRVLVTNGGSEAISLVTRLLGGTVSGEPDFGLYPRGVTGPRWRSNPHNPTGVLADAADRADVWDEAFYPLAAGRWTRGDTAAGAVVVGSLTKVFACPGLRAGYVLADTATIDSLRTLQPEWSVNGLAAAALPDLIATADLVSWHAAIAGLRARLVDVLREHGFAPLSSDANYVLVPDAAGLRDRLARRLVVVRDCASFGLPDHVRVAVPDAPGLARLEEALLDATGRGERCAAG
jgi:histidinol-phosphate/aromatic aminotransferase/cobyric acid decarboxylase-like protein